MSIAGTNPGDFAETTSCGATVAAGANCAINVTFTPTAAGNRSATLYINDNANSSPQSVVFSGVGAAQTTTANINPSGLSFGQINVGSTSVALSEIVTNTGNATLNVSSVVFSGSNPNQFAQTNTCGTGVLPGASCTINVSFEPTAAGNFSASMTVNGNAYVPTVIVTGQGIQPSTVVILSPSNLTFGLENEYATSPPQTVTLSNTGSTALGVNISIQPGSLDFAQTNNCGSSVAAGGNCTISVTFTPGGTGTRVGSVQVSDNAPNNPQVVSLSGTAVPPATPPGTYTVTVQASSNGDVHLLNIPVTVQ
jgi:hypothetical protein